MKSYSSGHGIRRRPRAALAALITGVVLCAVVVFAVLLPVLGLIGGVGATTFGTLRIPIGAIAASIAISYLMGLGFLALTWRTRFGVLAWITAVAAVIATLVGSLWPLVATASASVSRAEDVIPFVQELIGRFTGS